MYTQTIISDNAIIFEGEVLVFAANLGITTTKLAPYYAQSNKQAESTNKVIKENLRKVITNNPRVWHELLPKVLWA